MHYIPTLERAEMRLGKKAKSLEIDTIDMLRVEECGTEWP